MIIEPQKREQIKARVLAMSEEGFTVKEIARELHVSSHFVTTLRGELGIARRYRKKAECGTPAGYQRHRHHNEPVCDLCREAHRVRGRETYRPHRKSQLTIPEGLLVEMYLSTSIAAQERCEAVVGVERMTQLVARHDERTEGSA